MLVLLATVTLAAQSPRPWMQGNVEKSCAIPSMLEALKKSKPGQVVLVCHCQHSCDPMNEHTEETNGRGWDATCEARCNPDNCTCPHPCES